MDADILPPFVFEQMNKMLYPGSFIEMIDGGCTENINPAPENNGNGILLPQMVHRFREMKLTEIAKDLFVFEQAVAAGGA